MAFRDPSNVSQFKSPFNKDSSYYCTVEKEAVEIIVTEYYAKSEYNSLHFPEIICFLFIYVLVENFW